ncbi:benzoate--CoA ligase [Sedimentitalea sp. CY04]|uniref:Benzoate--CoA ligase n=1 Tax=Parasedimentitalea denitrificans TaxID=2211118 RepID=A0ABX0W5Z2_9RHOB|nr:class I adenylate-forming enzyme family protein [Sedimentitalea sp. CY04]NIZ60846.1 benzoate--CoA ligase [Sedimentitalea sp. CY04]
MLSIFDQGPFKPCPAPFNLAAHVLRHAPLIPDKLALSIVSKTTAETWTYHALEAAVRGTGTGLLQSGLKPGDIVLMRLGNTVEFPIAYLGAIAAGLIPVPTSSQLTTEETAKIIADLSPSAILLDPMVACAPHPNQITTDSLIAMRDLPQCEYNLGDPDRLAYAVYTSGTSGIPRTVAHAHRAIWARQMMVKGWYDLHTDDRLLHAGAFNWTYTLGTGLMDPWTIGATALIPSPDTDLNDLPELMRAHRASIFAAAPGVYRKLLHQDKPLDLPNLSHGLSAGEKLSSDLRHAWSKATGTDVFEAYGMSECSTFISSSPSHPANDETLGHPQVGRRIAIIGADGPAPLGEAGIIAIHRSDPGLMLGYLNAPDETAAKYQGEWFLTGDLGKLASDGQITYLGRNDDMMNAGGFRVSPLEVEAAMSKHPCITQIGAAPVEVKPGTFIIAAFYTGPEKLNTKDLQAFANTHLARYKQPRAYIHLNALPLGPNGKLSRRALPPYFKASSPHDH